MNLQRKLNFRPLACLSFFGPKWRNKWFSWLSLTQMIYPQKTCSTWPFAPLLPGPHPRPVRPGEASRYPGGSSAGRVPAARRDPPHATGSILSFRDVIQLEQEVIQKHGKSSLQEVRTFSNCLTSLVSFCWKSFGPKT